MGVISGLKGEVKRLKKAKKTQDKVINGLHNCTVSLESMVEDLVITIQT